MEAVRKLFNAFGFYTPQGVALHKTLAYYCVYTLMLLGLHKFFPVLVTWSHRITDSFLADLPKVTRSEPQWVPIAEVDAKDLNMAEFHEKYLKKNIPVVLRGLGKTKGWTAYGQWNLEFFKNKYPDVEVAVFKDHSRKELFFLKAKEFIEKVERGEKVYGRGLDEFFAADPALMNELNVPLVQELRGAEHNIGKVGNQYEALLFISAEDTYTQIHSDVGTNVNIQLHGRKEWLIFPPDQAPYMYSQPCSTNLFYRSAIQDPDKPDVKTYPAYKYATGHRVMMNPGDGIYIPPFWWHGVKNRDKAIGCALDGFVNLGLTVKANPFLAFGTLFNPLNIRGAFNLINKFDFIGK